MSLPSFTFRYISNIVLSSLKGCNNIDSAYNNIPAEFKTGYSVYHSMPIWWDSSYVDEGYYDLGTDYRGDYNNSKTTQNGVTAMVTASSNYYIKQVSSSTVDSQMNSFLSVLGVSSILDNLCERNLFLWYLDNLMAYYQTKVVLVASRWNQSATPLIYDSASNITSPFYPRSDTNANNFLIRADIIVDMIAALQSSSRVEDIDYLYSFTHNGA